VKGEISATLEMGWLRVSLIRRSAETRTESGGEEGMVQRPDLWKLKRERKTQTDEEKRERDPARHLDQEKGGLHI